MNTRFLGVIGSLAVVVLLSHANHAESQAFPADALWVPVTRSEVPIFDPPLDTATGAGNSPRDVVNSDEPCAFVYADEVFFYFRLRVDGDPTSSFVKFGWVVEMDLNHDPADYEALAMVDGGSDLVRFYTAQFADQPSDLAGTLVATFPVSTHARAVSDGSADFFMDWAIPKSLLFNAGSPGDWMRLIFGANANRSASLTAGSAGDLAGFNNLFAGTVAHALSDLVAISCKGYGCQVDVPQGTLPPTGLALTVTPNPMRNGGRFEFDAGGDAVAELSVYAIDGRRVRRFSHLESTSGWHAVSWDGRDVFGRPVPSGIYSAVLRLSHSTARCKFALMK